MRSNVFQILLFNSTLLHIFFLELRTTCVNYSGNSYIFVFWKKDDTRKPLVGRSRQIPCLSIPWSPSPPFSGGSLKIVWRSECLSTMSTPALYFLRIEPYWWMLMQSVCTTLNVISEIQSFNIFWSRIQHEAHAHIITKELRKLNVVKDEKRNEEKYPEKWRCNDLNAASICVESRRVLHPITN